MQTGTETFYFYRNFKKPAFTCSLTKKYDEKDFIFVMTDAAALPADNADSCFMGCDFKPVAYCDENRVVLKDGRELNGFAVEYCHQMEEPYEMLSSYNFLYRKKQETIWCQKQPDEYSHVFSKTKSGFKEFLEKDEKKKIFLKRKKALYDSNGDLKDFVFARLTLDWDNLEFIVEAKQLKRASWIYNPELVTVCRHFKFKTGEVTATPTENDEDDFYKKIVFPKGIYSFVMGKVLAMRDLWADKKLGFTCSAKNFTAFMWLVKNPYEPNLTQTLHYFSNDVAASAKRESPLEFNEFCAENNIPNTKTLRKAFAKNPVSLVKTYLFIHAGFKDLNILKKMMDSPVLDFILDNQESFLYFAGEALKRRSEKSVCAILLKTTNYFMEDTMNMFLSYRDYIEDELKTELFEDGFTEYVHDALSKLSRNLSQKNIKIEYTGIEKKYACKIGEYNFVLPKTTGEIRQLGSAFSNCVGSYAESTLAKQCVIVYMKKKDSFELCIEVRKSKVYQALQKSNMVMTAEQREPFYKWLSKNNLEYKQYP